MSKNIYQKLFNIQQELKAPKNQFNKFGNYSYRSYEDILDTVKPLLNENKLVLLIDDEVQESSGKNYIKATAKLICIESGESIQTSALAREDEERKKFDSPQITGSTSSYARKYCLNGMFCINDVKDSDVTNTQQDEEEHRAAKEDKPTFAGPESEKCNIKNIWTKKTPQDNQTITKTEMLFIFNRGFQAGFTQDQVKNHILKKFNKTIDQLTNNEYDAIVQGYQSKILKKMEG